MDNKNIKCYLVEYIDDYDNRHLTQLQEKEDLKYVQNNYDIINIEAIGI